MLFGGCSDNSVLQILVEGVAGLWNLPHFWFGALRGSLRHIRDVDVVSNEKCFVI